jgi:hypothetical protein
MLQLATTTLEEILSFATHNVYNWLQLPGSQVTNWISLTTWLIRSEKDWD